jgi:hypothetical protein
MKRILSLKKKIIISLLVLLLLVIGSFVRMVFVQSRMYHEDYGWLINSPTLMCYGYEYEHHTQCNTSPGPAWECINTYCLGFLKLEFRK